MKEFKRKDTLNTHEKSCMKNQCNKVKYKCEKCKKEFAKMVTKEKHTKVCKSGNKLKNPLFEKKLNKFTCGNCEATFAKIGNMKRHLKVHDMTTDSEEVKCDYCKKSFSNLGNMKKHIKTFHVKKNSEKIE